MDDIEADVIVPLETPFEDTRGSIQPLVGVATNDVALVTSRKGAVRANHYHKTDWHYCYVLSGSIEYHHRPAGSLEPPRIDVITSGQMFYTPPLVEHAMRFLDDTQFIVMSGNPRDRESYESDVVRISLVS